MVLLVTIRSGEDSRENNDILKIVPTNARPGCIIFVLILSHVFSSNDKLAIVGSKPTWGRNRDRVCDVVNFSRVFMLS